MERDTCREQEARCVQEQPPYCQAACPVHVDVRGMLAAVQKQDFAAGFTLFARIIPFPRIISRICDHPCQTACKRGEAGGSLQISSLEQACVDYGEALAAKLPPLPKKDRKIAIAGGGLSGLTAAMDLARKGYRVTVYEKDPRIGGRVWDFSEQRLPRQLIEADFAVLTDLGVELYCDCRVEAGTELDIDTLAREHDAVYLGCGAEAMATWRDQINPETQATSQDNVFAGGGQTPYSPLSSILQGRVAALSIDRFLQQASLTANREKAGPIATKLFTSLKGVETSPPVLPVSGEVYAESEAVREAERCLQCQCLECVKVCEYMGHFGSYPKRYVREIYNNESIVMGIHHANKLINSCAACGLCAQVCPNELDMGEIFLEARRTMMNKGKMPPSAHDFALRDLEFSRGEKFFLAKHQPGYETSRFLFFPGCQLAASMPQHVEKTYAYLRERLAGGVGLMLGCCGAPAEWSGRQEMFQDVLSDLKEEWHRLGRPVMVVACATCRRIFAAQLPQMPLKSIWDIFAEQGLPAGTKKLPPRLVGIHDPCAARHDRNMQNKVRELLERLDIQVEEPELTRERTTCCSYGGLMSQVNPEVAHKVRQKRLQSSAADFVVYCAMCRDNFTAEGKRCFHLLDFVWDDADATDRVVPDYSTRRENRARLKNKLLREVWGENVPGAQGAIRVGITEDLRTLMEKRMILVEDVHQTIQRAEATGAKLIDPASGHFIACHRPACVTYWVEYSGQQGEYTLHNTYSHRMLVVEEAAL